MSASTPPPAERLCPACGGRAFAAVGTTAYAACAACGTLVSGAPEGSYSEAYYYHDDAFERHERRRGELQWAFTRELARALGRRAPKLRGARTLEVGCSRGFFVEAQLRRGVDARGIDLSARALERASARGLGARCSLADAARPLGAAEPVDVVFAWELLEHFDDPTAFLGQVRGHLREGGWFLGSTPNGGSIFRTLLGDAWHGCGIPQYHRAYYHERSIARMFERRGFELAVAMSRTDVASALVFKNAATALAERWMRTRWLPARTALAAALAIPEKLLEAASGRVSFLGGETLLFAARRVR